MRKVYFFALLILLTPVRLLDKPFTAILWAQ